MRHGVLAIAVVIFTLPATLAAGSLKIVPTTTLRAQTSNNTSGANSFQSQSNGNIAAGNASKLDIHSLLYPGANTKIYAHLMPWFGDPRHMNVGYNSQDPAQIHRQITDMISRGIDGVIIDWYGFRDTFSNKTTLAVMAEAQQNPGFTFATTAGKRAVKMNSSPGCTPQHEMILQYLQDETTFVPLTTSKRSQ